MAVSLERLVLGLFDSLVETPPWKSFLKLMEKHLGCRSCALLLRTPTLNDPGLVISEKIGPIGSPAMIGAFHDSPFYDIPDGQVQTLNQRLSEVDFEQKYKRFSDYRELTKIADLIGLNLTDDQSGLSCRFRFIRTEGAELFGEKDVAAVEALLPYLKSAVSVYTRLLQQQKQLYISEKTASQLGFGLVVLRADSQIVTMNAYAETILEQKREFFVQQGRLHCADRDGEQSLRRNLRLLEKHDEDEDCSFQIPCADSQESNWMVTLFRYEEIPPEFREENTGTYAVIVQRRTPISAEQISRLFDLTPAESQLAKHLVQGASLSEAAEKLGRSRSTVRVQLAAIFAKTGVHKQHQLISLILHAATKHSL